MSRLPGSDRGQADAPATSISHTSKWQIAKFESGKWSDLVIECNGRQWHVHRIIVCGQSPFLEKACEGGFVGSVSGTINLPDDDPSHVERMLRYMYAHEYSDIQQPSEEQDSSMVINVSIYIIADKYSVLPLKELAITKFKAGLQGSQNHSTLTRDVTAAIKTIYTTLPNSDRGLRDPLGVFFKKYKKALYNDAVFMEMVKSGIAEGHLSLDVIDAWTDLEGKDSVNEQEGLCSACYEHAQHYLPPKTTIVCMECGEKLHSWGNVLS